MNEPNYAKIEENYGRSKVDAYDHDSKVVRILMNCDKCGEWDGCWIDWKEAEKGAAGICSDCKPAPTPEVRRKAPARLSLRPQPKQRWRHRP